MRWLRKGNPIDKPVNPDATMYPAKKPTANPMRLSTAKAFLGNAMSFILKLKVDKTSEPKIYLAKRRQLFICYSNNL